jgi:hypothetical protein
MKRKADQFRKMQQGNKSIEEYKYIFIYPKISFEMCVLNCVKILGKVVKIRVFM